MRPHVFEIFRHQEHNIQSSVSFSFLCRTVIYGMYTTFFFVLAQSAILPLCESEFKHIGYKGCAAC